MLFTIKVGFGTNRTDRQALTNQAAVACKKIGLMSKIQAIAK
jgi:hypothetical protein